ncbi:MAG: hypothetical protein R3Y32_00195 [Bacillota bacterium]
MSLFTILAESAAEESNIPWTEILAFIAVSISLFSVLFTTWSTKKLQTSSARIEWIQNVRKQSAEFISSYTSFISEVTLDKSQPVHKQKGILYFENKFNGVPLERLEMLVLYFGPEDEDCENIDIFNKKTNSGKNEQIVKYLTDMRRFEIENVKTHKEQIEKFSEIMRIYLKIEWNKAKEGK